MCIFGIYLPYYDSSLDQYKLYMDTLDQLHVLIEQIDKNIPVLIMGDTNTVLPESDQLSVNWYHKRPFTKWSAILYEFYIKMTCVWGIFSLNNMLTTLIGNTVKS